MSSSRRDLRSGARLRALLQLGHRRSTVVNAGKWWLVPVNCLTPSTSFRRSSSRPITTFQTRS
ncbi:hypothetical protein TIFTF001_033475 [Ficus carica]|uniref:Uncharacterized protein n=1 Tax=Ficus carica TaxID=3494 RepID=A0AA88J7W9_FICCA|nr:hypothetical protein TIFTF001_033475 [Ficus carica]